MPLRFVERESRRYAQFPSLMTPDGAGSAQLIHGVSTRPADVSARRDDRQAERADRRAVFLRDFDLDAERLCHCVQVHQTRACVVGPAEPAGPREGFDLIATAQRDTPLMTFSADCPLILAFDPDAPALGLAHASWRCTTGQIAQRLVKTLQTLGGEPGRMRVGIGPSAGPCCYEVGEDVRAAAADLHDPDRFFPQRDGRMYFDLWAANIAQLVEVGVPPQHIEAAGVCTMCENDVFFSYRREGAGCGHFGLLAAMR